MIQSLQGAAGTPAMRSKAVSFVAGTNIVATNPGDGPGDDRDDNGNDDDDDLDEEGEEEDGEEDLTEGDAAAAIPKGKPGPGGLPPSGPGDPGSGTTTSANRSRKSSAVKQGKERDKVTLAGPIPVGQPEAARAWRNLSTSSLNAATGRPEETTAWLNHAFQLNPSSTQLATLLNINTAFSSIEPRFLEALLAKCSACSFVAEELNAFL